MGFLRDHGSLKRGNSILAVYINSVAGKDRKAKPFGAQPASFTWE
jgi:hypothetical protein